MRADVRSHLAQDRQNSRPIPGRAIDEHGAGVRHCEDLNARRDGGASGLRLGAHERYDLQSR
jgi:hypothetical protein